MRSDFSHSPCSVPPADLHLGAAALLIMAIALAIASGAAAGTGQELLAVSARAPAAFRGSRSTGAASIRRSRSCRSCPSCLTPRAIPGSSLTLCPRAQDALSQFEIWWRYPAQVALFFFGLVNAGVPLRALEAGTWGVPIAVIAGKPLGILIGGRRGARRLACTYRSGVGWRELIVMGFTAAIGFSIGLFFCAALLPPGQLRSEIRMGVLLSLAAAPLAFVSARLLRVGRFARTREVTRSVRAIASPCRRGIDTDHRTRVVVPWRCRKRGVRRARSLRACGLCVRRRGADACSSRITISVQRAFVVSVSLPEPNTNPIERSIGLKNGRSRAT